VIETADNLIPAGWAHGAHDWATAAAHFDAVGVEGLTADGLAAYADAMWCLGRADAQVFRVADDGAGWRASLWADATDRVARLAGFNFGGIVLSVNRSAFLVTQDNAGLLWRFDAGTGAVSEVATGGAHLVNANDLVRRGNRLTVVRNFSRMIATLRLSADGSRAELLDQEATAAHRVLTTATALRGRILYVDSKFDKPVASGPYEIMTDPTR
jgi:hypothetical protein